MYVLKEVIDRQMDSPKKPEWLINDYPPLTGDTSKEAVRSQTIKYPKTKPYFIINESTRKNPLTIFLEEIFKVTTRIY